MQAFLWLLGIAIVQYRPKVGKKLLLPSSKRICGKSESEPLRELRRDTTSWHNSRPLRYFGPCAGGLVGHADSQHPPHGFHGENRCFNQINNTIIIMCDIKTK